MIYAKMPVHNYYKNENSILHGLIVTQVPLYRYKAIWKKSFNFLNIANILNFKNTSFITHFHT